MGKYSSSNKLVRRLITKESGMVVLKADDPIIDKVTQYVSQHRLPQKHIEARELARQYRHYCHRLIAALKEHQAGTFTIREIALKHHVCSKLLEGFSLQAA